MKFTINNVSVLSSLAGNGMMINGKIIGCATIEGVDGDITQTGFSREVVIANSEKQQYEVISKVEDAPLIRNYVLVAINPENTEDVEIIGNSMDIVNLFNLIEDDAAMLDMYLPQLADQRGLKLVKYFDTASEEECFFFVTKYDSDDLMTAWYNGDEDETIRVFSAALTNRQFHTELITDNFMKLMLYSIVDTGQKRYTTIHRDNVIKDIASILSGVTYMENGEICKPSVLDIENMLNDIKGQIKIN